MMILTDMVIWLELRVIWAINYLSMMGYTERWFHIVLVDLSKADLEIVQGCKDHGLTQSIDYLRITFIL